MKNLLIILAACLMMLSHSSTIMAAPAKQTATPDLTPAWQELRPPQQTDFYLLTNNLGGYSLQLPTAFGINPLEGLPHEEGPMQLRAKNETLLCAVNVQVASDNHYYNASSPLPDLGSKQHLVSWQRGNKLVWNCSLSRQQDYNGDKLILEAKAPSNGKTYELLYVLPTKYYASLLAQALWSMNSFEILSDNT